MLNEKFGDWKKIENMVIKFLRVIFLRIYCIYMSLCMLIFNKVKFKLKKVFKEK